MSAIRKMLVATDFSEHADAAVAQAIELSRQLGAELHFVHAYALPTPLVGTAEIAVPDPYLKEVRDRARAAVEEVAAGARRAGRSAEAHLVEGPPSTSIPALAERIGADLIVMGTRGLSGLKHVLLGSVTERTLRRAPCAVLAVKSPRARD